MYHPIRILEKKYGDNLQSKLLCKTDVIWLYNGVEIYSSQTSEDKLDTFGGEYSPEDLIEKLDLIDHYLNRLKCLLNDPIIHNYEITFHHEPMFSFRSKTETYIKVLQVLQVI